MIKGKKFVFAACFALLVGLFILGGCDNGPPTMSQQETSQAIGLAHWGGDCWPDRPDQPDLQEVVPNQALISSAAGGTIAIGSGYRPTKFIVPAGALDSDTQISIVTSRDRLFWKPCVIFEFGPDGLVFRKPVTLDADMSDINPYARFAKLYYYSPQRHEWIFQGIRPVEKGRVKFAISHFSKYAISS